MLSSRVCVVMLSLSRYVVVSLSRFIRQISLLYKSMLKICMIIDYGFVQICTEIVQSRAEWLHITALAPMEEGNTKIAMFFLEAPEIHRYIPSDTPSRVNAYLEHSIRYNYQSLAQKGVSIPRNKSYFYR